MSSFTTYLIGFLVLIVGLALAAYLFGLPTSWTIAGAIVLLGIGIIAATTRTKPRDPQAPPNSL
ncbi:MAG TPA: SoxR reducing system RseC family protein [Longimicrobiaceae bacterium]|nr:SoxR reducing system RseC family protein [Longimicrobiaceae bacterium]